MTFRTFLPFRILALALVLALVVPPLAQADDDDDTLFGVDLGVDLPWMRVGTESAVYEAPRYGANSRLFVREKTNDGQRWRVYRGPNYRRIVDRHPDLGANASLTVLGKKIGTNVGIGDSSPEPGFTPRAGLQTYVSAPRLTYERTSWGGPARLYVKESDGREYVYTGSDLEAIAKANAHIAKHDSYAQLRDRAMDLDRYNWRSSPSTKASSHVQIWNSDDGYTVRTWTYHDGEWQVESYRGKDLPSIVRSNQRAAQRLDAWTDRTWARADADSAADGSRSADSNEDRPNGESPASMVSVEGLILTTAKHGNGQCVVIEDVSDHSLGDEFNLKSGDKLMAVDGREVKTLGDARKALRKLSLSNEGSVKIRRNNRDMTLTLHASGNTRMAGAQK